MPLKIDMRRCEIIGERTSWPSRKDECPSLVYCMDRMTEAPKEFWFERKEFLIEHQPTFELYRSSYTPVLEIFRLTDDVLECAWSPGNATRYELVLTRTNRGVMVTWLLKAGIGGQSVIFISDDSWHLSEKWGVKNMDDVRPIGDLLHLLGLTGRLK